MKNAAWVGILMVLAGCSMVPLGGAAAVPAQRTANPSTIGSAEPAATPRQQQRAREWDYLKVIEPYRRVLGNLWKADRGWTGLPEETIEAFAARDELVAFLPECPKYKDLKFTVTKLPEESADPVVACDLAARREKLARSAYAKSADAVITAVVDERRATIAGLAAGKPIDAGVLSTLLAFAKDPAPAVAELRKAVEPFYAALGEPIPADRFAAVTSLAPTVSDALRSSVRVVKLEPARRRDAAVEKAARKALTADGPPTTVRGVRVVWNDWKIYVGKAQIPQSRMLVVHALVQEKGDDFCRLYPIEARQQYTGGGTWSSTIQALVNTRVMQVAPCN